MGKYERKKMMEEDSRNHAASVLDFLHDLVYIVAAIVLVLTFCFRLVMVSGSSMKNTLVDGDYLLLVKNPLCGEFEQGDIVVAGMDRFKNGESIVKRVIATEGQTVDIDFSTGSVYVDGELLEEDYILSPTTLEEGTKFPLTVDDGCVFLMGDNRGDSLDSRYPLIGQVDTREILGKAVFLLIPGTDFGSQQRDTDRIGGL